MFFLFIFFFFFFFFKQKTAYEIPLCDWSSDVCSSDLQPPDQIWQIPFDGWLLAYHPKLVDAAGNAVPGTVLHHTAFWNENRSDFLCPNKEEHIFGAGSELTDWAEIPGYAYRVQKGEKIRIETMMYNPTATSYDKAYLEVAIPFQEASDAAAPRKNVYPAWMDV